MTSLSKEEIYRLMDTAAPSVVMGSIDKAQEYYNALASSDLFKERLKEWNKQECGNLDLDELRKSLLPAVLSVQGVWPEVMRQYTLVFWRGFSKLNIESFVEMRTVGLPQVHSDGSPIYIDKSMGERFVYRIENRELALGAPIKDEWICDGSVFEKFAKLAVGLTESFVQAEEIVHANIINTGRCYNPSILGDGVPLFSDKHPIDNNKTYSNILESGLHLNQHAVEEAVWHIREIPDQAGLRMFIRPKKLIVGTKLEPTAMRLLEDPVIIKLLPEGYQVLDYLDDQKAWYILTSVRGLRSYERKTFKLDLKIDRDGILILEGTHTYGCGHVNPRGIFGSFPKE